MREALVVAGICSAPALAATLVVGLAASFVQAVTQMQDSSLSQVPKLIGTAVVLALFSSAIGAWVAEFCVRAMAMAGEVSLP